MDMVKYAAVGILCLAIGYVLGGLDKSPGATLSTAAPAMGSENKIPQTTNDLPKRGPIPSVQKNLTALTSSSTSSSPAHNKLVAITPENRHSLVKFTHPAPELSEETIDQVLPPPFNDALKSIHGPSRNKYANFIEADKQSEWDRSFESKLRDVFSSPRALNALAIDSMACNGNFCELRALARDNTAGEVFNNLVHDLGDIGPDGVIQMGTTEDNRDYFYVLFYQQQK